MNFQRIEVDTAGLNDGELAWMTGALRDLAAYSGDWSTGIRLFFLDVASQLESVGNWREGMAWQLAQDLAGRLPDPGEPTRYAHPDGWREAPGL